MLKRKLNIPSTLLIQTSELTEFEKEKEALNTELLDCKARLLKLEEKEKNGRMMQDFGLRKKRLLKQNKHNWKRN